MIKVEGLSYSYSGQRSIRFKDFTIGKKERWLLLGASGSGKTTLLHLIGGLLKIREGKISVDETDISKLSETELDRFRGKHFGFIFQRNHLVSALTVRNNLLLAPFLSGVPADNHRLNEVLEQLDLAGKKDSRINQLSQGQAQRVAIGRALLNKPSVILADEPTSALDDKNCKRVLDLLFELSNKNDATLIVATHDQRLKSEFTSTIQL